MVGWFTPAQLIRTGLKAFLSKVVGEHSDPRVVHALIAPQHEYYDYTCDDGLDADRAPLESKCPREEIWIDYVSDLGDGWNPTYAIAYAVSQPELHIGPDGCRLPSADILVFGGDEVYPAPTREEYRRRLVTTQSRV